MFNRNPDVFYLYEPLAAVQDSEAVEGCDLDEDAKVHLLERHFNCDPPYYYRKLPPGSENTFEIYAEQKWLNSSSQLPPGGIEITAKHVGNCYNNNLCFRQGQLWACDAATCATHPVNQTVNQTVIPFKSPHEECETSCYPLSRQYIKATCRAKSLIVQKVIRLCTIPHFSSGVKAIFLFRDPRAILTSRMKFLPPEKALQSAGYLLSWI